MTYVLILSILPALRSTSNQGPEHHGPEHHGDLVRNFHISHMTITT